MGFKSLLLVILAFLLMSSIAYGQTSFNDKDLERYKMKSGNDQGAGQSPESSWEGSRGYDGYDSNAYENKGEWCQQAEQARLDISRASSDAAAAREHYESVHGHYIRRDAYTRVTIEEVEQARAQMDAANEAVDRAKKALEQLESEANRQGIPAGWLQCNFN